MKKHFEQSLPDHENERYDVGDLLGLGSHSVRKNYYPALQDRIEELERERNRYKWLFENALHGIFQGDLKGGFLAVNPAMAHICGYATPEALASGVTRLREQFFWRAHEFDQLRYELLDKGRISAREARLRRVDGRPVYVAITLLRRPDLGAEVVEAFVADITERHLARVRLEQLNTDLERRVEERTEALQNANVGLRYQIEEREKVERELVVAVNAAKEANRSKDKYLAAASHDLMQPLNAARLLVSTLQDSKLPEYESRLIDRVHRALEGAEDLLADLLDISKLDQQAMQPDLSYVDVESLVAGLAEEFEPVARNAALMFRSRLTPATVRTDPRMLTRILRNLLSNAFRYTRSGGVLLAMRVRSQQLRLEVWDTGIGIAEDKLEEIFTEFRQLLAPEAGGRTGVGLGLAIVERMARMLGCRVEVVSRPGSGSRFAITLPLANAAPVSRPGAGLPAAGLAQGSLEGCRVLVIDNDEDITASMEALLSRWGCIVTTARDEAGALVICRQQGAPQAILADYHLDANRTGCEAIYALRRACNRDIPAAIITADRSDACRRELQTQYMPVLNKPVKPNRLRALLSSLVTPPGQMRA
ncbi:MAG: NahK/ErcS family hybrid sensor histidine kinase/response regulator [Marinobacter sp.]|uniref:PAS domain-containing hybrid sensor histidine kinase/response regulator n=1 Tax=Marinobacter sp. TaxID=50741 RepID=UPI00299DB7DD|nr:NahK/ErcS family hybrid sensor histidine kinase/response regulator [Marinobacter sp.]MDX1633281.1 NahK/ErcS family hybrid sensor histidine kinase/response regulator [Marinobacter sp.]